MNKRIVWLHETGIEDVEYVGGKNASLGEMIQNLADAGVTVPGGFATTAHAYREFLQANALDEKIYAELDALNTNDTTALAESGAKIRDWIMDGTLPSELEQEIRDAYQQMNAESSMNDAVAVAVRSSATAEDLPNASFAGQQETYLNISGIDHLLDAVKKVFASLFNDRAISYRTHQGFEHRKVALSACIQRMIRSDGATSGVMFSLDTESGFRDAVFVTGAYGLGETVVQGEVDPDEFYIHKPTLEKGKPAVLSRSLGKKAIRMVYSGDPTGYNPVRTENTPLDLRKKFCVTDAELESLARQAVAIEKHYGKPMDIEWAKDSIDEQLYIVQARPETVMSRKTGNVLTRYLLNEHSDVLVRGRSIGQKISTGKVKNVPHIREMYKVEEGDVLVADITDPDWEPVMKKASAIVTNRGGRTCHAAIIARELGIPAVVGCGNATEILQDKMDVTISCAEGDSGYVYDGVLDYEIKEEEQKDLPELPVKIMLNISNPEKAFAFSQIPNDGVGLARLEFMISKTIGIHPKALIDFNQLEDPELYREITERTSAYPTPVDFYVSTLQGGISTLAAAFWPKKLIVRCSDFKSNEYANLLGGHLYEPKEENPMIGFRGASRYISDDFGDCFDLECKALKAVRDEMGLTNVELMIPFVRTVEEGKKVLDKLAKNGLKRGENGLRVIMMCEVPSNAILAEEFLEHFDGFSIGSNDLTQLTLGLDRDSGLVASNFDERDPAIKSLLHQAIQACCNADKYVGICGQGPSDHMDFAEWLFDEGIGSLSLNPDSVLETWLKLGKR